MMDVVAAGVIDGKIVTDSSCSVPASSSRCNVGNRPVRIAGQTTRGVAASMMRRRTLAGMLFELTIRGARTGSIRFPRPAFAAARLSGQLQTSISRRISDPRLARALTLLRPEDGMERLIHDLR